MLKRIRRVIRNDPSHAIVKPFFRRDDEGGMNRLGRLMWDRTADLPGESIQGSPMSFKISLAWLHRSRWSIVTEPDGWIVSVAWIRVHYCRSYGGIFV